MIRIKKDEIAFLKKAKQKFPNFDYKNVNYINCQTKVEIICPKHGSFFVRPYHLLRVLKNCPNCRNEEIEKDKEENGRLNLFLRKAHKRFPNSNFNYDKVNYTYSWNNIEIVCSKHGSFFTKPGTFLTSKIGCPLCSGNRCNGEIFIEKAKKIHGEKYNYSLIDYKKSDIKVEITCPNHGSFFQRPTSHLSGNGCPKCRESNGERIIRCFLEKYKINYKKEQTFSDCKNIESLKFDFYLKEINAFIEFDGPQHFEENIGMRMKMAKGSFLITKEQFLNNQKKDQIKDKYALENGIKMIRIPYIEFKNIEKILEKELIKN